MLRDETFFRENQTAIEIENLIPFAKHPLERFDGRRLEEMIAYIRNNETCDPIIVRPADDRKYEILNGHYRVAAAKRLKWTTVPTVILTGLSDVEALKYLSDTNPVGLLKKYGIDVYSDDYKKSSGYEKIKDTRIFVDDDFSMAMDEYIERFLLIDHMRYDLYESIYSMGNPYELCKEECADEAVAKASILSNKKYRKFIKQVKRSEKTEKEKKRIIRNFREDKITNLVNTYNRKDGGYIQQVRRYLGIDLESFDYSILQNMREKAKIFFFIYKLKNEYFCDVNVLKLLSEPSMENIDNSFLGWKTYNGKYIHFIKHEIEKEISLTVKHRIKAAISSVVNTWGNYMNSGCSQIAQLINIGYECSQGVFSLNARMDEPVTYQELVGHPAPSASPLELLYLKIVQYEYLGQMCDLLKIYEMTSDVNYSVPVEYIGKMREFLSRKMSKKDIEAYFESENVQRIAKYVYLRPDIDKEDRRRIRLCKDKVFRFLDFITLADPLDEYNMMEDVTELLIISCLQSILLDKGKEIFDYTFYGMEGTAANRRGRVYVHAALKKEKRPYDALQVYWVRRVMDRSYANVGDSNIRKTTHEYERVCIKNLSKLLKCDSVDEMLELSEFYSCKLTLLVKPEL